MAYRSAPEGGYDFGAKRDYRRRVWGKLLTHLPANGFIGLMPSIEGAEVEYLLKKGVPSERMVFVDRNAAIAATLSRRFRPRKAYGCDIRDAVLRMREDGIKLAALNLDLCGPISPKLNAILDSISRTRLMVDEGAIAVTVMKGRESVRHFRLVGAARVVPQYGVHNGTVVRNTGIGSLAYGRVALIALQLTGGRRVDTFDLGRPLDHAAYYETYLCGWGEYPSSRVHMLWSVFRMHAQPCFCDTCLWMFVARNTDECAGKTYLEQYTLRLRGLVRIYGLDAVKEALETIERNRGASTNARQLDPFQYSLLIGAHRLETNAWPS